MKGAELLERHARVVEEALAAAADANQKLANLAVAASQRKRVRIRRVFLFHLELGVDFGFVPEEFGPIEPFAAVAVPFAGPR